MEAYYLILLPLLFMEISKDELTEKLPHRYFFDQDQSSHWYMIPEGLRDDWDELMVRDEDDEENNEEIEDNFSEYRLDGGIRYYSFTDPSLTK